MAKKLVRCPECGKEFTKAGLSGHIRFKHGRQITTSQGKPSIPREEGKVSLLTGERSKPQVQVAYLTEDQLRGLIKEALKKELFKEQVREVARRVLETQLKELGFTKR